MEIESIIDCSQAKMVSSTYDQCIDDLESDSCAVLFPGGQLELPPSCNAVILQREASPATSSPFVGLRGVTSR